MKERVQVRVEADLLAWVDEYAGGRGSSRTAVLEAALGEFRQACSGGVPDLPLAAAVDSRVPRRYLGCASHPEAGAVASRGRMWCGRPGCLSPARVAS